MSSEGRFNKLETDHFRCGRGCWFELPAAGLSEGVPQHEGEAQPDDRSDDDGVAPFPEVDLLDQIVDQRKPGIGNNGCQIIMNS